MGNKEVDNTGLGLSESGWNIIVEADMLCSLMMDELFEIGESGDCEGNQ
jgi:hypothetical protein